MTEKYGTDAVRFALLRGAAPGTDIVLTEERMVSSRAFANKIWNAARFMFHEDGARREWRTCGWPEAASPKSVRGPLDLQPPERARPRAGQPRARAGYRYHEAAQT